MNFLLDFLEGWEKWTVIIVGVGGFGYLIFIGLKEMFRKKSPEEIEHELKEKRMTPTEKREREERITLKQRERFKEHAEELKKRDPSTLTEMEKKHIDHEW